MKRIPRIQVSSLTPEQIKKAKRDGIPFALHMADGKSYTIRSQEDIVVRKTRVVFFEGELVHVLPLLTVTGLTYLKAKN